MLRSANEVQQEFRNAVRGTFSSMKRPPLGHPLPAPAIANAGREEAEQLGASAILLPEDCGGIPDAPGEFVMFHAECGRALLSLPLLIAGTATLGYALWAMAAQGAALSLPIAGSGLIFLSSALILVSGGAFGELVYKSGDMREGDFARLTRKVEPAPQSAPSRS